MPPTTTWPLSVGAWHPSPCLPASGTPFSSVSLKQILVPALLPSYDPDVAPNPLSPHCDPPPWFCATILTQLHIPAAAMCHPTNSSQGISQGAVHRAQSSTRCENHHTLMVVRTMSALLGLTCPGQPHLGLAPRHLHGSGAPFNPALL